MARFWMMVAMVLTFGLLVGCSGSEEPEQICGDGICGQWELISDTCPEDCSGGLCGDGICGNNEDENCNSCPDDCARFCGECGSSGCFYATENCVICPQDCGTPCRTGEARLGDSCASTCNPCDNWSYPTCTEDLTCQQSWEIDDSPICISPGLGGTWTIGFVSPEYGSPCKNTSTFTVQEDGSFTMESFPFMACAPSDCNPGMFLFLTFTTTLSGRISEDGIFELNWSEVVLPDPGEAPYRLHAGTTTGTVANEAGSGTYTADVDFSRNDCSLSPFTSTQQGGIWLWRCHCNTSQVCIADPDDGNGPPECL